MTWIITGFSIIGVVANIYKKRWCFIVWTATNFSWMVVDFIHGLYSQAVLFLVYFVLAIYGWFRWGKEVN